MSNKKSYLPFERIVFSEFDEIPWPCFIKPGDGEMLTSWLTRLAHNHLVRYYAFCSANFSGTEFWNRDLDRRLPDAIKKKIISKSQLNNDIVASMCLNTFQPNVFLADLEPRSYWITQLLFYQKNRKHDQSMMVCTECFKVDKENPYYRKKWRLTISTICVSCGKNLIDECPQCGASINYLLAERGKKFQAPLFPITCCWKCLFNLADFQSQNSSVQSLVVQKKIDQYVETGHAADRGLGYSHLYFLVLKKIITLLNKDNDQLKRLQELICAEVNIEFSEPSGNRQNTFNNLKVEARRSLLEKAAWLLDDWPFRFRSITEKCNLRSKLFFDDFPDCPYWFYDEVRTYNQLVHSEWRKSFPDFKYGSFREFSTWQVSKAKLQKRVGENIRKSSRKED